MSHTRKLTLENIAIAPKAGVATVRISNDSRFVDVRMIDGKPHIIAVVPETKEKVRTQVSIAKIGGQFQRESSELGFHLAFTQKLGSFECKGEVFYVFVSLNDIDEPKRRYRNEF